jgi:hypothetical protein
VTDIAYISFVFTFAILGAGIGAIGHFARANMERWPEEVTDSDLLNEMMMNSYLFEKYAVGAEWDDVGYWDGASVRNLVYYVLSGFATPLLLGLAFWSDRADVVAATCGLLTKAGLNPPLCF